LVQYNSVLVCVTQQKSCERLIRAGAGLKKENGELYIIHVSKDNWNFIDNSHDAEAMEYLFNLSKSYGAELTILNSNKIPETVAQYAQHYGIEIIITGQGPGGLNNPFTRRLKALLEDTDTKVMVIPNNP
jgi:K+-sensing histidine kinase KdpD